jgi:hypothetical protein
VEKNRGTFDSRQQFYIDWINEIGLGTDHLLESHPQRTKNFIMSCYVLHLTLGHNLLCKTLKAATIRLYIYSVVSLFTDAGLPDPTLNVNNKKFAMISDILTETERWEQVANRKEPLTWTMVEAIQRLVNNVPGDSKIAAIADWFVVGMHTGFRISEWATPQGYFKKYNRFQISRDGSSTAITSPDVKFHRSNLGYCVTITWRWQKNKQNGQKITFSRCPNDPARCPYVAMLRIINRAKRLNIPASSPLSWYKTSTSCCLITDNDINSLLRTAASIAYGINEPEILKTWTAHSIRVGACVALHEAGADPDFIKKRLRWESESYQLYLRNTPRLALQHANLISIDINT